jgi:Xaa-Pro aminopeptidase
MKADLDRLMSERGIDVFIIMGNEGENSYRDYITNGVHASATVIKKHGDAPILIANGMEVDEAKKSGYEVMTFADFNFPAILKAHPTNARARSRALWQNVLDALQIRGRLAFYGTADVMSMWKTLRRFAHDYADLIEIVEDDDTNIFSLAQRTKDPAEIEKMRDSGQRTSAVLRATREWLAGHRVQDETLIQEDGTPLTIGAVKHFVRLRLMEQGMEDNSGMIFAQGRDAAVPHSRGESEQALKLGQTIVFDLFPRPIGGGYYHDSTRTWCLGYAPDEVKEAYDLVMHAFSQSLEAVTVGRPTSEVQNLVCDIFEEQGHPTGRQKPGTQEGYVHSLGHGLGLQVHEGPGISHLSPKSTLFEVGNVVAIEPGLYYPDKGWGIRIEDTVTINQDGHIEKLTDCPYDLVIPLDNA